MVLHDINLSARYADYIFAMRDGMLICEGEPREVIIEKNIRTIYDLDSIVINDPFSNTPMAVPKGRYNKSEP